MKIALFISNKVGIKLYNFLKKENKNINLIVTRDRSILKQFKNKNVSTILYNKNNINNVLNELKNNNIDLNIVFYFCILPKKIWNYPKYKSINIHYSLLYSYAGVNPVEWQVHNKEKEGGFSISFIDNKIDNGKIIFQKKINIHKKSVYKIKKELNLLVNDGVLKAIELIEKYKENVPIIKSKYKYSYYSYYKKNFRLSFFWIFFLIILIKIRFVG